MNIFFDTEFTGLTKDADLISVGCISENGNIFYGILNDYDKNKIDEWIQKNVIDNLDIKLSDDQIKPGDVIVTGDSETIRMKLLQWLIRLKSKNKTKIEFISDVCHYDMVLLIDLLFGHGLKVPYNEISACCYDINQDIAKFLDITQIEAFNYSREKFIQKYNLGEYVTGEKHNSLYDAKVIKTIYDFINLRK